MAEAEAWARDFFSGTFVDMWLQAIPPEQTVAEADFLERVIQPPAGAALLDLACGGGRHSLELARRGYRMTGVDLSAGFLNHARTAAAQRKLEITWEERAMHDLPWTGVFDGAYCLGNSLGGLDDAGHAALFAAVARALKPGGRFVVDSGVIAESAFPNIKERGWWPVGDIHFLVHNRYDPVQSRLNMDFTYIRNGKEEKKAGFSQIYTFREFRRLIEGAGFQQVNGYSSLALEPYQLGSHSLYLVATK